MPGSFQTFTYVNSFSLHNSPLGGLGKAIDELGVGLWGWGQGWDLALPQEPPCGSGDGTDSGAPGPGQHRLELSQSSLRPTSGQPRPICLRWTGAEGANTPPPGGLTQATVSSSGGGWVEVAGWKPRPQP